MSIEQYPQPDPVFDKPFAEFVTKTVTGCQLQPLHESERDPLSLVQPGCDHCYMYTHSTAWQDEPPYMEQSVLEQTAFRIGEHATTHGLTHVRVIAHGGEPLLALTQDPDYYSRYAEILHRHIDPSGAKLHLFMQTNGLMLNGSRGSKIIEQLKAADFNIGLSIDGTRAANDLHRRDKAGRSTHSRAERAAQLLAEHEAKWGVLGVIDPRNKPEETVEYLASLKPQAINLFPMHAHHSDPPAEHPGAISLGEWQKRAFDYYVDWAAHHPGTDGPPFEMPIYDNYLRMAFGAPSLNDTAGARVTQELFITPSGKWERLDTFKSTDDGAVFTGLNIFEHSLDRVRRDPGIVARRMGLTALAPECLNCDLLRECFGGHPPNRYKRPEEPLTPESSVEAFVEAFRNPSIHCESHKLFLTHVKRRVRDAVEQAAATDPAPEDVIAVPEDASKLDPEAQLNKLLLPFRVQASKQLARQQEQAGYDIIAGRTALEQLQLRSSKYAKDKVLFCALGGGTSTHSELHAMLSIDHNDAIVNTVLEAAGMVAARQKVGGYWFVGRNAIEKLLEDPFAGGYVAAFNQNPSWQLDINFNGEDGIDYWQVVRPESSIRVAFVNALDLPGDVFVVDAIDNDAAHIAKIMDEIKSSHTGYASVHHLAGALRQNGVYLEPLHGIWPESTNWIVAPVNTPPKIKPRLPSGSRWTDESVNSQFSRSLSGAEKKHMGLLS